MPVLIANAVMEIVKPTRVSAPVHARLGHTSDLDTFHTLYAKNDWIVAPTTPWKVIQRSSVHGASDICEGFPKFVIDIS